ncbi:hypothetical protein, partial [Mucilaginibacter rubeus]|uniref:hypothetical protein n=1 Tax=Mucilaginibacter rubeus TaxID=2027860 RepID=UPI0033971BB8
FALSSTLPFGSAKVENLFLFPKLFYFLFLKFCSVYLSSLSLFNTDSFTLCMNYRSCLKRLQRCEFHFDLASENFTFFLIFLFAFNFQKTTPLFLKRSQMYTENQLPTKIYFQIIKPILQLPVN